MPQKITAEYVEQLALQLPAVEQLQLMAHLCEQLSRATVSSEVYANHQERLHLAEALLADCQDVKDDAQGTLDAAAEIRQMRKERLQQICQSDV
jgi:hypothetical protein